MERTKKLLGARIKELRKVKGLSQDQLSEKVGIDPKHLSRIEVGKGYPSLDTLGSIGQALNVEIRDFFDFDHLEQQGMLVDQINELLKEADEKKVRLVYKIAKAIIR